MTCSWYVYQLLLIGTTAAPADRVSHIRAIAAKMPVAMWLLPGKLANHSQTFSNTGLCSTQSWRARTRRMSLLALFDRTERGPESSAM